MDDINGDIIDRLYGFAKDGNLEEFINIEKQHDKLKVHAIQRDLKQRTLLHFAAGYGRTRLASYLIRKKFDVNAQDIDGMSPLHSACCHGHYNTSKILIDAGADVNLKDNRGWSPLDFAVARQDNLQEITECYWKVIRLLIERGADPYQKSTTGRDCFSRVRNSADKRRIRFEYLANRLNKCNDDDEQTRQELIDRYLSVDDFFEWVKLGDEALEVLKRLVTPKMMCSRLESYENITPLHRAAGYNHINSAELFIENGARVDAIDSHERIPLHNAAQYGHVEMIELLVNKGSDINKQDCSGYTPLHIAASNKTFTACLKLIEMGANIEAECKRGRLPYDLAQLDDVREVLKPESLRYRAEVIPSSSDQGIYIALRYNHMEFRNNHIGAGKEQVRDELMLDSNSNERLFKNVSHFLKKIPLNEDDARYQTVKRRMLDTIVAHEGDPGGQFTSFEILNIDLILHEKAWSKYRMKCSALEFEHGPGSRNEKLLFHGSKADFIDKIEKHGFDERYAQTYGMFGAGIYFAEHSSKSNQYTFGWGNGCQTHQDKSCYICKRKMIYAQVALGRSLESKVAIPNIPHGVPHYNSVTGNPKVIDDPLKYPEYVIYSGDQAYPLFVINYRIIP